MDASQPHLPSATECPVRRSTGRTDVRVQPPCTPMGPPSPLYTTSLTSMTCRNSHDKSLNGRSFIFPYQFHANEEPPRIATSRSLVTMADKWCPRCCFCKVVKVVSGAYQVKIPGGPWLGLRHNVKHSEPVHPDDLPPSELAGCFYYVTRVTSKRPQQVHYHSALRLNWYIRHNTPKQDS